VALFLPGTEFLGAILVTLSCYNKNTKNNKEGQDILLKGALKWERRQNTSFGEWAQ